MNKYKKDRSDQLGMPYGTATTKLRLKIIFDLLTEADKNYCSSCSKIINFPEELSVVHKKPWFDVDPNLFWRTDNLAFRHQNCEENEKMKIIEVTLVNEQGEELETYKHDNQLWAAGTNNERYNIRIKNNTSSRIEVVCSVDGRDVISGAPGDYKTQRGYIINPFDSYKIEGFRQNNENVAAFRFADSKQSYTAKMGTPKNVGIIGVAIFKEKFAPIAWRDNFWWNRKIFPSNPYNEWYNPLNPWPYNGDVFITCNTNLIRGGIGASSTLNTRGGGGGGTYSAASVSAPSEIGTEYGESLFSSVGTTHFVREVDSSPNEISLIRYDSMDGLAKRGIDISNSLKSKEPQAFPGVRASAGFAPPPPK